MKARWIGQNLVNEMMVKILLVIVILRARRVTAEIIMMSRRRWKMRRTFHQIKRFIRRKVKIGHTNIDRI